MTAQHCESICYQGQWREMNTCPLDSYFLLTQYTGFKQAGTALTRGYLADWEIIDDRLYLCSITTDPPASTPLIETLFPGCSERVFAHWYSGVLVLPEGNTLPYLHLGFASQRENERWLNVKRGVITGFTIKESSLCWLRFTDI